MYSCMSQPACGWCASLQFAWDESSGLLLHFASCIPCTRGRDIQRSMFWRWNPMWWLCIFGSAICILFGQCFHAAFDQGGEVRHDENETERRARVWWAYSYSGALFATILVDFIILMSRPSRPSQDALSSECAMLLQFLYMLGNVNLLWQMRCRNTMFMRAAAGSRLGFGVVMVAAFLWTVLSHYIGRATASDGTTASTVDVSQLATWMIRFMYCCAMVLPCMGYAPLLQLNYATDSEVVGRFASPGLAKHVCRFIVAIVIFLLPLIAVAGSFMICGPMLWEYLAGK
mmetsp:Transcript_13350/g.31852  ORF Transcript_13350/g.31852 Transcript_13350/m.31852 type:complete len:287 (+) Transcript_13350:1354-2214(+)